jgi:hypothetical protein
VILILLATVASSKNTRVLADVFDNVVKLYYASRGVVPVWFHWGSEPKPEVIKKLTEMTANSFLKKEEVLVPRQEVEPFDPSNFFNSIIGRRGIVRRIQIRTSLGSFGLLLEDYC